MNLRILLLIFVWLVFSAPAYAIQITPPRLVMGADKDLEHVFIKNDSDEVQSYRFSWRNMAMTKDGEVINLDKVGMDKAPGYRSAGDILRFSPRRTTLKPGEVQRITFLARRSSDLPDGEYRSHFLVEREEPKPEDSASDQKGAPGDGTHVSVDLLISRAFPIYVHNGKTSATLKLLQANVRKNPNASQEGQPTDFVSFDVQKEGNRSVIGVADVLCGDISVARVKKIFAVYAEGEFRKEEMGIELPAGKCQSGLRLVVKGHADDPLADQVIGELPVK
jgi:hypothetical protein